MKKLGSACLSLAVVVVVLLFANASAHAQFRTSIQGTVTDPDGAVVAGAQLSLKDNATDRVITATSDNSGTYNFNALPPDRFTLTVNAPGFQQKVIENLQVIPEQPNAVAVKLEVGEQTTTITVSGEAESAVDTETSNIGATVDSNLIQHAPSFNRDVLTLTQLAPGSVSDGSQASGGGVYAIPGNQGPGGSGSSGQAPTENRPQADANGQQNLTNGISIDGISTVSAVWGGASIITPTEESVDNVRIVTNDYDAENGRFSGAQTLITSKSGTNQLHGSAFIAIHRPGLNAFQRPVHNAAGAVVGKPVRDTARFNQYGGSLGGPIFHDKLFAFFAFESSPNSSTTTGSGWYETAAFAALAPPNSIASKYLTFKGSGVSTTGIITSGETCASIGLVENVNCRTIAGQGLNIGSPLTSPLGTQDLSATGTSANPGIGSGLTNTADIADYATVSPFTSYYRQFNGRMDANVTAKDHLAFAIYWVPTGNTNYNPNARAYNLFHHDQINEALSVIWNRTFTPTFLNEARANAAGWRWNEIGDNPQAPVGLPQAQVAAFGNNISIAQFGSALGSILNQWTYSYKDVATKVFGRHTIKFGGEYTNLHYLNNPIGRPNFRFYDIWDFLNDAPYQETGGFNSVTGQPGGNRSDDRENLFGFFVQDDWKAIPNLTLHAGLRYSYFGALYAKQNNLPVATFGSGTAMFTGLSIRLGGNLWTPQKSNFGPQVGFNWSPRMFDGNVTIRGGYGLNFNQEEIAISANAGNNPPTQNFVNYSFTSPSNPGTNGGNIIYATSSSPTSLNGFPSNPHAITSYNSANLPTAGNANVIIIGTGTGSLPTQYAHHYSLDIEHQLSRQIVFSIGYQGSSSHHLINHQTPNSAAVVAGVPLNPLITGGDYWTSGGSGNNNALLLELKHPFVHHFSLDAQFQWARSMDTDGSGPYYEDEYYPLNPKFSYGRSDYDVRNSFKLYGLWQPVIFRGSHGWAEKVVGGWSLSGILQLHTGFPFSPNYGISQSLYCSQCGYFNLRPYYLGGGGSDHGNKAFETGSNFTGITAVENKTTATVNGNANTVVAYSNKYFAVPNFASAMQAASGTGFPSPNAALPPPPGLDRNAFTGPGYRDVDASLTKGFGLPNTRLLGESAKFEIRADIFNLFNILNLNPGSVANNVNSPSFGSDTAVLGSRTISFQGRFSF